MMGYEFQVKPDRSLILGNGKIPRISFLLFLNELDFNIYQTQWQLTEIDPVLSMITQTELGWFGGTVFVSGSKNQ